MATHVKNSDDFKTQIKKVDAQALVLLEFSAKWCAACTVIGPEVEKIAKENPIVKCFAIDVDDCEDIASEYNVIALPTIHFVKDGNIIETVIGAKKAALQSAFTKLQPEGMLQEHEKTDKNEKDENKDTIKKEASELATQKEQKPDVKKKSLVDDLLEMAAALPENDKKKGKEADKKLSKTEKQEKKDPKEKETKKKESIASKKDQENKEYKIKPLEILKEDAQKEI